MSKAAEGRALVVVESPAKAKTIGKYLGRNYIVKASVGHVRDLPKSQLGVDIDNHFAVSYVTIKEKAKVIDELREAAGKVTRILLATDPDREGEAIAWHVSNALFADDEPLKAKAKAKSKSKKKAAPAKGKKKETLVKQTVPPVKGIPVQRILFNEITKKAILESVKQPLEINKSLCEAQQTRRVLDRLVGYQVSPLLWDKVRRGLSAGRVQSVAARLICDREREIKAFIPVEYWTLQVQLEGSQPPPFLARLVSFQGKKFIPDNQQASDQVVKAVRGAPWTLNEVIKKERRRHAPAPFITSKLQQDAAQQLGFTARRTMSTAQQLYEGIELGEEGLVGLITYMRTDSYRISADALQEARSFIQEKFGADYLPEQPNVYKSKKSAQDAHEAVRPTTVAWIPDQIKDFLTSDQYKLYRLIWQRFLASQMTPTVFDQTSFEIGVGDYGFRAVGSVLKFPGFRAIYTESVVEGGKKEEEEDSSGEDLTMPDLAAGETLKLLDTKPEQHFTEPPPRFSEASLIKELEEQGIGRPSTYAAIISNIVDREYVVKDQTRLVPTDLGFIVIDLLVKSFPDIFNVEFTAKMEQELDEVEEGNRSCVQTLEDFYAPFKKDLELAKIEMKNVKRQETPTEHKCQKCSSSMVIKWGRRGEFLACTNYPECRSTHEFKRDEAGNVILVKAEVTGEFCTACGGPMVVKSGRFGRFLACSNYPECKTTKAVSIGINCPECQAPLSERRTKRGKVFYGCTKYPKCHFASWDKPIAEPCPTCQAPFLVLKKLKKGDEIRCSKKECDFIRPPTESAPDTTA